MRTVSRQPNASLQIRSITWRRKEDRSGPEYHQELLLEGLHQFQRQRLTWVLSRVALQKFLRLEPQLDQPKHIREGVELVRIELLDIRRFQR